jgi:hypothetical protein
MNAETEAVTEATNRGTRAGYNAATWVFDGNTPDATRARVAQMIADGDPQLYDTIHEPQWLSGEWAGESITELIGDLLDNDEDTNNGDDNICEAYENAATDAFWNEVSRSAEN